MTKLLKNLCKRLEACKREKKKSDKIEKGKIISQSPTSKSVDEDSTVTFVVSSGKEDSSDSEKMKVNQQVLMTLNK